MRGVRREEAAAGAVDDSMEFSYRLHDAGGDRVLAICDAEILGRTFEEGQLRMEVSEEFYSGGRCGEKAVAKLVKSATIVNAVGRNIVDAMVRDNLVEKDRVLRIQGVPHAQAVSL